jgi:hypothetical protein
MTSPVDLQMITTYSFISNFEARKLIALFGNHRTARKSELTSPSSLPFSVGISFNSHLPYDLQNDTSGNSHLCV